MSREPYTRFAGDEIIFRDHLAVDRTVLANERTVLSYARTALAFALAGGSIIHSWRASSLTRSEVCSSPSPRW
jgi:putative membrane protein